MPSPRTDHELLRAHVERPGDAAAFAELVERHVDMVYAAACRQVGRGGMADDVAQATFILLARKAARIDANVVVAAWLHKATRYAALNAMKIEHRRRTHERRAGELRSREMRTVARPPSGANVDVSWAEGAALLDVGVARLGDRDRTAVVLRFLERRSFAEVGQAMGVSEEAAQMRVGRALEKLRGFFRRHGLTVTAATLRAAVNANAFAAAPASLKLAIVSNGAMHAGALGSVTSAATLADAAGRAMDVAAMRATSLLAGAGVAAAIVVALLFLRMYDGDVARHAMPDVESATPALVEGPRFESPSAGAMAAPRDWARAPLAAIAARLGEILTPPPLTPPVETAQRNPPRR